MSAPDALPRETAQDILGELLERGRATEEEKARYRRRISRALLWEAAEGMRLKEEEKDG